MTGVALNMTRQEARLLVREPATVAWAITLPLVANAVLHAIPGLRRPIPEFGNLSWSQTYLPTILLFALSVLGVQVLPSLIATYRQDGILRRLRTTPASPANLLTAVCGVIGLVGLGVGGLLALTPWSSAWPCRATPRASRS